MNVPRSTPTRAHVWRKPRHGSTAHAIRPAELHRFMPMSACGADFRRGLVDYAPGMPLCTRCTARVTPPEGASQ